MVAKKKKSLRSPFSTHSMTTNWLVFLLQETWNQLLELRLFLVNYAATSPGDKISAGGDGQDGLPLKLIQTIRCCLRGRRNALQSSGSMFLNWLTWCRLYITEAKHCGTFEVVFLLNKEPAVDFTPLNLKPPPRFQRRTGGFMRRRTTQTRKLLSGGEAARTFFKWEITAAATTHLSAFTLNRASFSLSKGQKRTFGHVFKDFIHSCWAAIQPRRAVARLRRRADALVWAGSQWSLFAKQLSGWIYINVKYGGRR